jgi:hypothetical protein
MGEKVVFDIPSCYSQGLSKIDGQVLDVHAGEQHSFHLPFWEE